MVGYKMLTSNFILLMVLLIIYLLYYVVFESVIIAHGNMCMIKCKLSF